jgi:hypothetical protein
VGRFFRAVGILLMLILASACARRSSELAQPQPTFQPGQPNQAAGDIPAVPAPPIDLVQLAWFWNSPRDLEAMPSLVQNFDFFVFTSSEEEERDQIKMSAGEKTLVLQYMLFNGVGINENCEVRPYGNQIANQRGDFCTIRDEHPDWLLYDSNRAMIYNNARTYVRTDPKNLEWRQFFASRLQQTQQREGWDGVFLDNVDASLGRSKRVDLTLPLYPTDADLQAANEEMLAFLYLNYYKPGGRPMFANIPFLKHEGIWYRYLEYLDGAMLEDFAVGWNEAYKKPIDWEWQMDLVEGAQDRGKIVILVSQGQQNELARQEFAFASYLLVNQGRAFFRYTHSSVYNKLWLYENYNLDLGQPLGRRYLVENTWTRNFEKGTVTVNPTDLTSQIVFKSLPGAPNGN